MTVRVVLDLNVFVAYALGIAAKRTTSASSYLVDSVGQGVCPLGSLQLVISWGMLNRLQSVLIRKLGASEEGALDFCSLIAKIAEAGAFAESPTLTLGGAGVIALKDEEDAHVLETAIAGNASLLVTRNFKDFLEQMQVIKRGEIGQINASGQQIIVAQPNIAAQWFREGKISL